eukprot:118696-Rhodomonas_salina.1
MSAPPSSRWEVVRGGVLTLSGAMQVVRLGVLCDGPSRSSPPQTHHQLSPASALRSHPVLSRTSRADACGVLLPAQARRAFAADRNTHLLGVRWHDR